MPQVIGGAPLQISVLGEVQIEADQPRQRARGLISACAWLALHPGATGPQMDRALGMSAESRTSTISRLRGWLGAEVVPLAPGRYRVYAWTDWSRFCALVCEPSGRLSVTTSDEDLVDALQLVRGEPLADVDAGWAEADRLSMALLIADVSGLLARRRLERGQLCGALWSLSRGLTAFPGHPDLVEMLAALRTRTVGAA